MTPDKRKKIKALMESPASSENEKEICRKLLAHNPEPKPTQVLWSEAQAQKFSNILGGFFSGASRQEGRGDATRQAGKPPWGQARRQGQGRNPGPFTGKAYTPEEFERAQAAMDQRLREMNQEINKRLADILKGGR